MSVEELCLKHKGHETRRGWRLAIHSHTIFTGSSPLSPITRRLLASSFRPHACSFVLVFIWAGPRPRDHSRAGFIPIGMCQTMTRRLRPGRACIPHPNSPPNSTTPCISQDRIISVLGWRTHDGQATQYECPPVRLPEIITLQVTNRCSSVDSDIYLYQQAVRFFFFHTTTLFEVFFTIRRFR